MSFFKKSKVQNAVERLKEEQIYEAILKELQQGIKREGLWAKAIARSEGNDSKVKSLYIEYRAQSIIDEIEISEELIDSREKKDRLMREESIRINKENDPQEIERIKRLKRAAKSAGAKYIPSK